MPLKVGPKVILSPKAEQIIRQIAPYMPQGTEVIGGFLDEGGQLFKLNYHWELLNLNLDRFIKNDKTVAPLGDIDNKVFVAMKARLAAIPPPQKGYLRATSPVALPDMSKQADIVKRWSVVLRVKNDLKAALKALETSKLPSAVKQQLKLCGARIRRPGTSNHGQGWALDLAGDQNKIQEACAKLKASLIYPEDSHVHVEFEKGVTIPSGSGAKK